MVLTDFRVEVGLVHDADGSLRVAWVGLFMVFTESQEES